jgi:small subunit ribosomal protein S9
MADDRTPEQPDRAPAAEEGGSEQQEGAVEETAPTAEAPASGEEQSTAEEQPAAEEQPPVEEQPTAEEQPPPAAPAADEQPAAAQPAAEEQPGAAEAQPAADAAPGVAPSDEDQEEEPAPRAKPAIPGADLEVDIVVEGVDPFAEGVEDEEEGAPAPPEEDADQPDDQPIAAVTIDLAAGARYRATGKRKTAVARVILRPGTGAYSVNGRDLVTFFPRETLQRTIRQPLETVGYESRMDVVARLHGGGVAAQAGALRHGISRGLLEADPNLRGELKRRGFLTRDARAKERKKAGLKKARKRPQFSKR